jgi:hypothetical protein
MATRLAADVAAAAFGAGAALPAAGEVLELMRLGQVETLVYLSKAWVAAAVLTRRPGWLLNAARAVLHDTAAPGGGELKFRTETQH